MVPKVLHSPFPAQFPYPRRASCTLIHSKHLNALQWFILLFISPFWGMFFSSFPDGLFLLIIWRLTGHTKSIWRCPCTLSLHFQNASAEGISPLESYYSLPGLLLPCLLSSLNPQHSDHAWNVRSCQSSPQGPSRAPQLIQSWQSLASYDLSLLTLIFLSLCSSLTDWPPRSSLDSSDKFPALGICSYLFLYLKLFSKYSKSPTWEPSSCKLSKMGMCIRVPNHVS